MLGSNKFPHQDLEWAVAKADDMIDRVKRVTFSREDQERQRRSFAYGNAKTENDRVTRAMVDKAAEKHPRKG